MNIEEYGIIKGKFLYKSSMRTPEIVVHIIGDEYTSKLSLTIDECLEKMKDKYNIEVYSTELIRDDEYGKLYDVLFYYN